MTAQFIISWLREHVKRGAHLCLDSRQVNPGDVFFACPGLVTDGRLYVDVAINRGAGAIVAQADFERSGALPAHVPVLTVDGLSGLLGRVASEWYGEPSRAMSVVAITGTNGKTSTVQWLAAALKAEGVACGVIGTLGISLPDGSSLGSALTTPDVVTMHRSLAAMRDAGAAVVAIEASSIGLDQGRLDQVHVEIAGFTNLTHDHLDYHHTLENYKAAKFALFALPGLRAAVINVDDPAGIELLESIPAVESVTYSLGIAGDARIQARDIHAGAYGLVFNLTMPGGAAQIVTRLVARHNVSNLLLVAGVLHKLGWSLSRIARTLAILRPVPGRLQIIDAPACGDASIALPMVVVDYAHTPDALQRALAALRDVARSRAGRLICLFGCGGNRDRSKRPMMGRIAQDLADKVILTSDNPRAEPPGEIIEEIVLGMSGPVMVEIDRAQAILAAIWQANSADVVLLAGKGHETYQESAGVRIAFDDREWARFALTWQRAPSVSTDSRKISRDQIFVALEGATFDGHEYLNQASSAGACAAIVARRQADIALPQFVLGDTHQALIQIGTAWRRHFHLTVIGVTGSNGKTTTKEMIASILRAWLGTDAALATEGNLNNDIGVPLTLLRLTSKHRAAVVELGMNHPGEIALLAGMARPTIALVNNAQREHQEFMHTVEAVARENGAVFGALPEGGVAVFPGDDAYAGLWQGLAGNHKMVRFGLDAGFDVYADQIHAESARTVCRLYTPEGESALVLGVPGLHNLRNALAAAACASAADVPLRAIVQGLANFEPVAGRLQSHTLIDGMQLIDDTYNANPDSVRAAIDVLARLQGKKILVLGDMGEVGANGAAMHVEVGAYARECAIDSLLAFGPAAAAAAAAFGERGRSFDSIDELVSYLATLAPANILVKGSRSTHMERVVRALAKQIINRVEGARHAT